MTEKIIFLTEDVDRELEAQLKKLNCPLSTHGTEIDRLLSELKKPIKGELIELEIP